MDNWVLNRLVLVGCLDELNAVRHALIRHSSRWKQVRMLREYAISPTHADLLPDTDIPAFRLEGIMPVPSEVRCANPKAQNEWRKTHWGTPMEAVSDSESVKIVARKLSIKFYSSDAPPLPWVRFLSSIFPSVGVALHYATPFSNNFRSVTFRGGKKIQDRDYGATDMRDLFMFEHFGWAPDLNSDRTKRHELIDFEMPVEDVTNGTIAEIRKCRSVVQFRQMRAHLRSLGLSKAGACVLIARYGRRIPEVILDELLEYSAAAVALSLRASAPRPLAIAAARQAFRRLLAEPLLEQNEEVAKEEDRPNEEWYQKILALRRLVATPIEVHGLRLSRIDTERAYRRYRDLDSASACESPIKHSLAEILARSRSTSSHILDVLCPTEPSYLADILVSHPNISLRTCAKLLEQPLGLFAQMSLVRNSRLVRDPNIVRAMIRRSRWWGHDSDGVTPEIHPYTLCAIAACAPIGELAALFDALADDLSLCCILIESLPPERRAVVPKQVWLTLLQSEQREIRQRVLVLLGDQRVRKNFDEDSCWSRQHGDGKLRLQSPGISSM